MNKTGYGQEICGKRQISRDILFGIGVMLLFLSSPLFMTYLPNMGELQFYFCQNDGLRGPFLTIPLLLLRAGMDRLLICQIYILIVNLFTCVCSWYAFAQITDNKYAGLAGSLFYSLSVYSMMIRYDKGLLGEMTAYAWMPLVICGIWGLILGDQKKTRLYTGISAAGLAGVLYSSVPLGIMAYIVILLTGMVFFAKRKTGKRRLWWMAAIVLPILAAQPVLRPWMAHMGGSKAAACYAGELFLSYRIRMVIVCLCSMAVSCLGRYIHDNRRRLMGIFMISAVVVQVCGGIFYMNELLYSTEPVYEAGEEYAPEEFLLYINR